MWDAMTAAAVASITLNRIYGLQVLRPESTADTGAERMRVQVCAYCGTHPKESQQNCINCGAPVQRRVVIEPLRMPMPATQASSNLLRNIIEVVSERHRAGRRPSRLVLNTRALPDLPLMTRPGDLLFGMLVEFGSQDMEKDFEVRA